MFVLRRITSAGIEINSCLGAAYNFIRKIENEEEYKKTLSAWLSNRETDDDEIYGFIVSKAGQHIRPLYRKSNYFIMMSDGQTFANISFR